MPLTRARKLTRETWLPRDTGKQGTSILGGLSKSRCAAVSNTGNKMQ